MNKKSDDEITLLERIHSHANESMFTLALQYRRLKTVEPEDKEFVMRWYADMRFLILEIIRFRKIIGNTQDIPSVSNSMKDSIEKFDNTIPNLKKMRNVSEHIAEYIAGNGRDKGVNSKELEVMIGDEEDYEWLGVRLNFKEVIKSAENCTSILNMKYKKRIRQLKY